MSTSKAGKLLSVNVAEAARESQKASKVQNLEPVLKHKSRGSRLQSLAEDSVLKVKKRKRSNDSQITDNLNDDLKSVSLHETSLLDKDRTSFMEAISPRQQLLFMIP